MGMEMKKIALIMIGVIFAFSSLFGAISASNAVSIKETKDRTQELPKFDKIKIVNDVPDYTPEVYLNEKRPNEKEQEDEVQSMHVRTKQPGLAIPVAGGATVTKLRLVLKDQKGKRMSSDNKTVTWENDEKAEELKNVLAGKLRGINVTLERSSSDKDTLVITVKKGGVAEAEKKSHALEVTKNI